MFKYLRHDHRLIMLALFTWALGEGLWYSNLRQLYLVELGATSVQVGIALAIEASARTLLLIPAGYLVDRIGPRRVMIASWLMGIGAPLLMALAPAWQMAVPGLALYALSAFAVPSINAFALQHTPDRDTPGIAERVLTSVAAAYPAGLILSPTIGGLIADRFSIRACLWLSAAFFVFSTLIITRTRETGERDRLPHGGIGSLPGNIHFIRLVVYCALLFTTMLVGTQLIPNFLRDVRDFSFGSIGFLFSLSSAGTVIVNLLAGRLNPRWSLVVVLATYWLALLGIWRVPTFGGIMVPFVAIGSLFSVGALIRAAASYAVNEQNRGLAFGIIEMAIAAAMAVSAWIAGRLYSLTPAHDLPFIAALTTIPVMLALWFVVRPKPSPAAESVEQPFAVTSSDR